VSETKQGTGAHLPHGSVTGGLNGLRVRVALLERELRDRLLRCSCVPLRGTWRKEPCNACKATARVLGS
jgi:hypothetical protein